MSDEGIAIIGLAGRFPGARNVAEFWANLVAGRETIARHAEDLSRPNYVPARGILDRPEWFDAGFFGLTPREAEVIDPQQRVFLEEAWTALEDAGIDPARPPGPIGIFAGMSNNTYWANNVSTRPDLIESVGWLNAMMGNEKDYLATRVAYKFDLRGPAISLYTACSTSLVAVCQACTSLLNFQCDAALAGGISITFPQERGYEYHEGGITSPDGHCRTFDVKAAGTVFSHGVGVVVLKRLADALAAGDQIYAVIKGHALNNDGSSKVSFTAPSVDGHAEVIALAQGLADFSPESISYIEAHGTATPLGDPIEIAGLTTAFRSETARTGFCAIGSVKTNIGHLDAAAGVAGLIKTALALKHGKIPASLHFTAPNSALELASSPFFVNTALSEWTAEPRRAGVSSFGVGGTNAHVVLEGVAAPASPSSVGGPQLLVLSARSLRALEDATENLGRFLRASSDLALADVALTLQQGRHTFAFRRFVVAENTAEAGRLLLRRDRRRVFTTPAKGVATVPSEADELSLLGHRWLAGEEVAFPEIVGCKLSLPTYPFERQRYWAEPSAGHDPARPAPAQNESNVAEQVAPSDPLVALKAELTSVSGVDVSAAPPETTFIDLGFDSLLLTQIAIVLQKKFGVKLRFRQFLDELSTLGALAAYLAAGRPATVPTLPVAPKTASAPVPPPAAPKPAAHGPFRRIDTSASAELTAAQQRHLDDLVARYTQRTAGSKRFTAEQRPRFADPRALAGFRRGAWKEMVYPLVADRSLGSKLWDIDGNEYTDITLGFGQILLGHRPPFLVEAIEQQLHRGIEIGPTSPLAGDVVNLMCELTGMERVGFCNTGSEAVMAAIRVARTVSGRDKIAVFAGAYHGIFDEVLFRPAGGGAAAAIAPGIPEAAISNVFVLDYGEESALEHIRRHAHEIAAVLVEPVQSRRPDLQPRDFLHALRQLTAEQDIALVFDEVVTGFRCHLGGAQAWFGIRADIGTYGKIPGGGLPIGMIAGSRRWLDALDGGAWNYGDDSVPEVGVTFFAGTFVRHPLALAAAKAVLTHLKEAGPGLQEQLNATAQQFVGDLNGVLEASELPVRWARFSSVFYLSPMPEWKYAGALWTHLRLRGIHAWEGRPNFISTAHTAADLTHVLQAFRESVEEVSRIGFWPKAAITNDAHTFPLTSAQQEMWLAAQLSEGAAAAYNESVTLHFRGQLDVLALQTALNALVARHEALRITIAANGLSQRVHEPAPVELPVTDEPLSRIEVESSAPFDLARGPLFRAVLLRLAPDHHALVLTIHHIVADGWSFGTLVQELAALYSGASLTAPAPFRDYVRWLAEQPIAETERYWLHRFASAPPSLDLPTDRPRSAHRSFRANRRTTIIPAGLVTALQRFSGTQKCTLFTTMLGVFHVLLHRLSEQDDIVVGIAAAGQAAMGRNEVVGHCLNFLPVRAQLDDAQSFTNFLARFKNDVLDAFDHQQFTLGDLLPKLDLPRDPSRPALAAVTFNIDRAATGLKFAGVQTDYDINAKTRFAFELSFNLFETDHGWQLYCAFSEDLFEGATIERWLGHFLTLLESVVADPAATIRGLPMLHDAGRSQVLNWSRGAQNPFPAQKTIHEIFAEVVAQHATATAVSEGEATHSYRDIDRAANRVANHLVAHGLEPGGIVGLRSERGARFVIEALGVLRAGGAYLPIAADEPVERLRVFEKTAALILLDPSSYAGASDSPITIPVSSESPAYLIFTSGSTGTPKGVIVPHRAITRLVCRTDYAPLMPDDVVSFQSNLNFDAATFEIWGALLNGARLALTSQDDLLDPVRLAKHYRTCGINTAFVTTALFNRLVRAQPDIFSTFKHVLFGGERCDPDSVSIALEKGKPANLLHVYGPTETTTFATFHPVERVGEIVPIGRPIANTDVFILDAALALAPVGVVGEIYIGGPGLAIGYDDAALTAQRFIQTPLGRLYKSGDRARWLADGTIDIMGRVDRQIKLRGFRIEPGEVEAALRAVPGVGECVVTLRDGSLVAYLTANSTEPPPPSELREHLGRLLPAWMLPSAFVRLERLPLTANGKVDVRALPAPEVTASERRDGRPETTLHFELIALWQRTLGQKPIGIHDDFFTIGGHSLLAAQMLAAVEQQFGIRVPFSAMFERPTIAHLAERLVGERRRASTDTPLVPIQTTGTKTPFFFLHGDFSGGGFFCRDLARHLGEDRPFYALHPHGLHGELPPPTIEAMAMERLAEVRRVQPKGPYLLGGFCNGALVAFEMARQLAAAGETIDTVVMIGADGSNFRYRHVDSIARRLSQLSGDDDAARAARFLELRRKAMDVEAWGRSQMMRIRAATSDPLHVPRRLMEIARGQRAETVAATPDAPPPMPPVAGAANPAVVQAYTDAIDAYLPGKFQGRVILVWANDDTPPEGGITYGWKTVCEDVQIVTAPGDHHSSIALEENLRELAARLLPVLERS